MINTRFSRFLVVVALFIAALSALGAMKTSAIMSIQDTYERQLSQISTTNPVDYYELGERLIADDSDPAHDRLGTETLVIGLGLAHEQDKLELAASICIAIASTEHDSQRTTDLWDLAYQLDPARRSAWEHYRFQRQSELQQAILDAALCIGAARNSDEQIATDLFGKQTVRDQIRIAAQQSGEDPEFIASLINQLIADASDDDCRGRVFSTLRENGEIRRVVCQEHARPIGSAPSDESLRSLIKVEYSLAMQSHQNADLTRESNWGTTTYLELDEPVRELSVEYIAAMYHVDLKKPLRRGNQWVSSR